MNRILTFGFAAVATTLLSQPVYADKDKSRGGGGARGGGGGGGGARISAPAVHANFGQAMRAPSMPQQHFAQQARPQFNNAAVIGRSRPNTTFAPSVVQNRSFAPSVPRGRSFVQPQRNAPSIAFGGSAFNNNNNAVVNARNARTFAATNSSGFRGNAQAFRAPTEVSRGWDRGHEHTWNHHHFRWSGGDWVILDGGYDYPYTYGYDNGYSNDYDQPDVTYATPTPSYGSSESVAMSVQDQLARMGYSPGPVDGVIGPQTRDAIADFQSDRHLPVTGEIDRPLLQALGL